MIAAATHCCWAKMWAKLTCRPSTVVIEVPTCGIHGWISGALGATGTELV
jgi:hypothetical protein